MGYNFVWSAPSAGAPIVTIATYGITFNSSSIEVLRRPTKVMIGFDDKQKVIGVKPLYEKGENEIKSFPFAERERNGYVRIGNKDFIKYVSSRTEIDFTTSKKYFAHWDDNEQLLIIKLDEPIDDFSKEHEEEDD